MKNTTDSGSQTSELSPVEAHAVSEAFSDLDDPSVPSPEPARILSGRSRLLSVATGGVQRYAPFFGRIGALFDLSPAAVEAELERAQAPGEWSAGPRPEITLFHLDGGPQVASADTGFVRIDAGVEFPHHQHTGQERAFIMEGGYTDDSGRLWRAGDLHDMSTGSQHGFRVLPDSRLVLALVLWGPVTIGGVALAGLRG